MSFNAKGLTQPWVRNPDWIPIPAAQANEVYILARVNEGLDDTFASIKVVTDNAGQYTVDWGLGSTTNYASNVMADVTYTYATAPVRDQDVALGYKQVMIKVTPVTGSTIKEIYFNQRPSGASAFVLYPQPFLDVDLNLPNCTVLQTYATNCQCRYIERWNIRATGNIIDMSNIFNSNASCQQYNFPAGFGSEATNMNSVFASNAMCQQLDLPAGFGSKTTTTGSMFLYSSAFKKITFPAGFGSVSTNMTNMFYSASSFTRFDFPDGFGTSATNMSGMFRYCNAGVYNFPAGFGSSVTTAADIGAISSSLTISIKNLAYAQSFSIANSSLQRNALIDMFNALPTVTGKTFTITGNPGVSALTEDDKLIATNKGWTLVLA